MHNTTIDNLIITIRNNTMKDVLFKVKPNTKFSDIYEAYCVRQKYNFVIMFNNKIIDKVDTPNSLNMIKYDNIVVYSTQLYTHNVFSCDPLPKIKMLNSYATIQC